MSDKATKAIIAPERFNGEKLNPWTAAMPFAADAMGMKYPFVGTDGVKQWRDRGVYPGQLIDIGIFLWLRTGDAEARVEMAINEPSRARVEAAANAVKLGIINYRSERFTEAAALLISTLDEVDERKPKIEKKNESEGSDDPL